MMRILGLAKANPFHRRSLSRVPPRLGGKRPRRHAAAASFGLTDWTRNGSLAEYVAVEARNLAPLPADVDHTVAAALPTSGLTAWQGLFDHGRLAAGQTVLIQGTAGGVGSIAVQVAREAGARVIGTGRAGDRDRALGLGEVAGLCPRGQHREAVRALALLERVAGVHSQTERAAV
jgi:NADPH:quinone reductase-like Zn-dependent oxidoreductase